VQRTQEAGGKQTRPRRRRRPWPRLRRELGFYLGLTGQPRATRRYFRFAFVIRALFLLPTPLFFLLPGQQYAGSTKAWIVYAFLVLWFSLIACFTWRDDEWMKRAWYVHVLDLVIAFGAFVVMTHSGPDVPDPKYGDVVIVGSFQLQTYGVVATAAALTGIVDGVAFGIAGAAAYVACLRIIGTPLGHIVDPSHIQGSVARTLLYVTVGVIFGLFNVLVGRLVHTRRRTMDVIATARSYTYRRTAAEERSRFLNELHERGLGKLHAVRNALEDASSELTGLARDRVQGITSYYVEALDALQTAPSDDELDDSRESVADVLRYVCKAQGLVRVSTHTVELELGDGDRLLSKAGAVRVRDILGEALHNAVKHSESGEIVVQLRTVGGEALIVVSDPGPKDEPGRGNRLGHQQITRRVQAQGWSWDWRPGAEGRRSELLLLLSPDRALLARDPAI
jgi:signal transduction histidine kinase